MARSPSAASCPEVVRDLLTVAPRSLLDDLTFEQAPALEKALLARARAIAHSWAMMRSTPAQLIAILFATVLAAGSARADQREDFLAGKTRSCPRCDLSGQNFKRRDLANADLTGANLKDANFHDARLTNARLGGADLSG